MEIPSTHGNEGGQGAAARDEGQGGAGAGAGRGGAGRRGAAAAAAGSGALLSRSAEVRQGERGFKGERGCERRGASEEGAALASGRSVVEKDGSGIRVKHLSIWRAWSREVRQDVKTIFYRPGTAAGEM